MSGSLLDALLTLTRDLARPAGLEALVSTVLTTAKSAVGAERAALYRVDVATGELVLHTDPAEAVSGVRLAAGTGLAGWVAANGVPVRTHAATDPRFFPGVDDATGYRTREVLAVPLLGVGDRVVGVLQLLNKDGGFTADDQALLEGVGPACAMAIASADLVDSLEERNRELARAHEQLRQRNEELDATSRLERSLAVARDEGVVLHRALDFLVERYRPLDASALLRGERNHVVSAQAPDDAGPVRLRTRRISKRWAEALLQRFDAPARSPDAEVVELSAPIVVSGARVGALQLLVPAAAEPGVGLVALVASAVGRAIGALREQVVAERGDRLALIGQMMGGLLHDLRNPLSALAGYVELLAEEDDPSERQVVAARAGQAITFLETMAQEVLEFSRGTASLAVRDIAVERFVDEVREIVEPDLRRFGAVLERGALAEGRFRVDPGKLRRVVANLARNAGEAGARRVVLQVSRAEDAFVLEVADDGPGIHEEVRERLFQPFATFGKPGGTGLGLAMALRVVEAHGGTIEAVAGEGPGAVFRITLPADAEGTPVLG
jgi:signal transduction histidine kinase